MKFKEYLKENPDLVVLDDPISSFDGNKKFAIINMLFMGKHSLKNRTVLLLTHEFNTVIDAIYNMPYNFNPTPTAAFLTTKQGILQEKEITKVKRKIPSWFSKPNQLNHKILVSYLKLSNKNTKSVKIEDLINILEMNDNQKIIENFRQMKTMSEKNHGKVFTEEDGFISLWNPVSNFIVEEYEKLLKI